MRRLLIPLSWLYGLALCLRNSLYDLGFLTSVSVDVPVIVIGNLHVGGTGKSPLIAYTASLLKSSWSPAILSRGYGRSTRGFHQVFENDRPSISGDEPLMLRQMLPNTQVFVCENRVEGIRSIRSLNPSRVPLLLDDAFQHRRLKAGLNVLLCPFNTPWHTDYLLPAGRLREGLSGLKRANLIVVTKTPADLSLEASLPYIDAIRCGRDIPVLFSTIRY
ncbi:MAG: tetraacyldisaccharide 4'-kinase, partial [Bacteroidota bacterium]